MKVNENHEMIRRPYSSDFDLKFINRFFDEMHLRVPKQFKDYTKSLRRSKTMASYLTALYIREGQRTQQHYISAAKNTTMPQLQDLAEKIAVEILLGEEKESLKKQPKEERQEDKHESEETTSEILRKLGYETERLLAVHRGNVRSSLVYMKDVNTKSPEDIMMLIRCLAPGGLVAPGRDRLWRWVRDEGSFDMLEYLWMEKMVDAARKFFKFMEKRLGFTEQRFRPYQVGDDFDLVDYEETIENLHDQGKKLKHLKLEDIIVKDLERKRLCITYLLDISGSMKGLIHITKGLLAGLLQAFHEDEFAVGLFKDDFYAMKDMDEYMDSESVTDDILSLGSNGGTILISGLDWAKEQFQKACRDREKVCIVLGDFNFYWPEITYEKVEELTCNGIRLIGLSTGKTEPLGKTRSKVIDINNILNQSRDAEDFMIKTLDELYETLFLLGNQ